MSPLVFIAWCLAAYLVGTISWSYLLVRRLKGIDLRTVGSGNLGATNAGRVLGKRWAVGIYFLDTAKGIVACGLPPFLFDDPTLGGVPVTVVAGLVVMLGHNFPFWLGFKGGKGVATGSGVMLALEPLAAVGALVVWVAALFTVRIVSAASMLAALSLPLWLVVFGDRDGADHGWKMAFFAMTAVLVVVMHRANVARILAGTEPRIGRKST